MHDLAQHQHIMSCEKLVIQGQTLVFSLIVTLKIPKIGLGIPHF